MTDGWWCSSWKLVVDISFQTFQSRDHCDAAAAAGMDRLLSCVSAELVDMSSTDNHRHHHNQYSEKDTKQHLAVATGRLATFRQRLPPLTFLPCGVRPADPSPPASPGTADIGDGLKTSEPVLTGRLEHIADRYVVSATLGRGTFGSVLRAECRRTGRPTALKKLPKETTKPADFRREFVYGRQMSLGLPTGIVATYDEAFETATSYVFAQELAPCGDLLAAVSPPHRGGLGETRTKRVARQLAAALSFLHARRLVHRDVKPENVLLYDTGCRLVKLGDFGVARRSGTVVCRVCAGTAYTAPEVCSRQLGHTYRVDPATDVWAYGVVLFALMTGNFPWRVAYVDTDDRLYADFVAWQQERQRRSASSSSLAEPSAAPPPSPEPWSRFTEPFVALLHRLLDTSPLRRASIDVVDRLVTEVTWTVRRAEPVVRRRTHASADGDRRCRALVNEPQRRAPATGGVEEERQTLMDAASRSDRVSHWLQNNKELDSTTATS